MKRLILTILTILSLNNSCWADPLQGRVEETNVNTRIQVQLLNKPLQAQTDKTVLSGKATNFNLNADHGVHPVGVIGLLLNDVTGEVWRVYPLSNLNRWDIRPGDYLINVNGTPYSSSTFKAQKEGEVGQPILLTFYRNGKTLKVNCPRVDARLLASYTGYDNYFVKEAQKTRYW
jgi:S1-C subfamily serine protease